MRLRMIFITQLKKLQREFARYSKSKCYNSTMIALGQILSEKNNFTLM